MKSNKLKRNLEIILLVALLMISVVIMMDLQSRLNTLHRLTAQRDLVLRDYNASLATAQILETREAYITSDAAVEDWARGEGHMSLPGDIVVVPIAPQNQTPTPLLIPTPTPMSVDNWSIWRALLLGE